MHIEGFLHKMLSSVMHKKRLITLSILVATVLQSKRLSLTELGRAMDLPIKERSCIRRSDRFLGNIRLYMEREAIYKAIIKRIVGIKKNPDIIVDWSPVPNTTHHTLRAAMVAEGRALTLYEEVHPEKKLGNNKVQNIFLHKLKKLLPDICKPTIITDAGFHNDWFKEIVKLGWHYLGRIRGKKYLRIERNEWQLGSSLFNKRAKIPKYLGKAELCKSNPLETNLCLFRERRKGRKGLNKFGKRRSDSTSLDYRRAAKEPWLLATSLSKSYFLAQRVIKKYSNRMQIEEGFRDLKSSRYGFGFENAYSGKRERIEVLLLIAMLASFVAWLVGWIAEKKGLHFQFQSNSIKNRRVLSLFYLGCQVIRRKIKDQIIMIMTEINDNLYDAA